MRQRSQTILGTRLRGSFVGLRSLCIVALFHIGPSSLASQSGWSVIGTPDLDITGYRDIDGENVKFANIVSAVRLSSGVLVVADAGNASLHFYSPADQRGRIVSRAGGGPGEFRQVWWMGRCFGDSLFVWDAGKRVLIVFDSTGKFVSESRALSLNVGAPTPYAVSCFLGVFATQPAGRAPELGSPIIRGQAPVFVVDTRSTGAKAIPGLPAGEMVILGGGAGPRPLGRQTSLAVGLDRVYIGTADSATLLIYSREGQAIGTMPLRVRSKRATLDEYVRAVDAIVANVPVSVRARVRDRYLELPPPEYLPPYFALLVDHEGTLWVVTSPPGTPTSMQAYDALGRLLADVKLPLPVKVMDIGDDFVLGAHEDASGELHLVSFKLRRGS